MKKLNKIFAILLAMAAFLTLFAGCGKGDENTFVVGFDAEFPPYGYKNESGEYVGFDLDLAKEVCKRKGWKFVAQPIQWDFKDVQLDSGAIDCIWNGFTVTGRETEYTWTKPYVDNSQVFVVKADSGIKTKADLADKNVAVQADSSALAALNDEEVPENIALKNSFKTLTQVADYNTAFMNLDAGAVDAIAVDYGVAKYQLENRKGSYEILSEELATEQYAVGFKLGNEALRGEVEAVLLEMMKDGTFMQIAKAWELEDSVITY